MSLDELKNKLEQERDSKKAKLLKDKLYLESLLPQLDELLHEKLKLVAERKQNWRKEVEEIWGEYENYDPYDRDIYGQYYDELLEEIELPVYELQDEIKHIVQEITEITSQLNLLDFEYTAVFEKAKKEYEEVAVLRWLS